MVWRAMFLAASAVHDHDSRASSCGVLRVQCKVRAFGRNDKNNDEGRRDMNGIARKMLLWGSVAALAGCGTIQTSPRMNASNGKLSVTAVSEPFGLNDIPVGTYRVPDTAFAVRKYTTVSTTAGAFGALGVAAAHSSGADASKASVDGVEGIFRVDMAAETMRAMKTLRSQGHGGPNIAVDGTGGGATPAARSSGGAATSITCPASTRSRVRTAGRPTTASSCATRSPRAWPRPARCCSRTRAAPRRAGKTSRCTSR